MTNIRRQQPLIITYLSQQLGMILAEYLLSPHLAVFESEQSTVELISGRRSFDDRLPLKIVLTLSNNKRYQNQLLFRDYRSDPADLIIDFQLGNNKRINIYAESITYVQDVLLKPLQVIGNHEASPTNMHHLLAMLCNFSQDKRWYGTRIERSKAVAPDINEAFFTELAKTLKKQCSKQKISVVSQNFWGKYGKFCLFAHKNQADVPEDMSLLDVVNAVPIPLSEAVRCPSYFSLLESILISLNEKYGLLRSCGLPPHDFMANDLSVGTLRELKVLRKTAEAYLKSGVKKHCEDAYRQAFKDLLDQKSAVKTANGGTDKQPKFAGFEDFYDFSGSKAGICMLNIPIESLGSNKDEGDFDGVETIPDPNNTGDLKQAYADFLKIYRSSFTPITQYVYGQVLLEERPLNGQDSVLNDAALRQLITTDPKLAALDSKQLLEALWKQLDAIFKQHSDDDNNPLKI